MRAKKKLKMVLVTVSSVIDRGGGKDVGLEGAWLNVSGIEPENRSRSEEQAGKRKISTSEAKSNRIHV